MQRQVNYKLFEGQTIYTGIDYHLKNWRVTIYCGQIEHKQMTINPSPEILASYLKKNFPGAIYKAVYEAGFSGFIACRKLIELGIDCIVVHAADVPTTHKEKQQKTDSVDSRKLVKGLMGVDFAPIHVPNVELETDRALLRVRSRISKDIARTKNRVKSLLFQFGINIPVSFTVHQTRYWSASFTEWLKALVVVNSSLKMTINHYLDVGLFLRKKLLEANRQVRALSQTDGYKDNYALISSIPGFGCVTGMCYLVQIGDINRFENLDKLNYYVGLVPKMNGSGDRMTTGKLVNRGHKDMKIMLIEASWVAIRHDPALMASFIELSKKIPKNKAIVRIARKLLNRLRFVLTNKQRYEVGVVK
jgi:transposase